MPGLQTDQTVCHVGACTDIGRVRRNNEDAHAVHCPGPDGREGDLLFLVADGMGGHAYGDEASRLATRIVADVYYSASGGDTGKVFGEAFARANADIFALSQKQKAQIGTTCTALSIRNGIATVAHVGDSRAYLVDGASLRQLTIDHSLAASLYRDGIITLEQSRTHPGRSALTRALGVRETCEPDVVDVGKVRMGTSFVLCTDGLSKVTDEELESVVRDSAPQAACEQLVAMANERGGGDNATVIVVRLVEREDN